MRQVARPTTVGDDDLLLITVGAGVGSGLLSGGRLILGSPFAAGEFGHVTVGTDGGPTCACGKDGCLEAWLSVPSLGARLAAAGPADRDGVLRDAGERLGIAIAPIVGALDLPEIVLSGPRTSRRTPRARDRRDPPHTDARRVPRWRARADDGARPGHRPARRRRRGPVGTTRRVIGRRPPPARRRRGRQMPRRTVVRRLAHRVQLARGLRRRRARDSRSGRGS